VGSDSRGRDRPVAGRAVAWSGANFDQAASLPVTPTGQGRRNDCYGLVRGACERCMRGGCDSEGSCYGVSRVSAA
jgi:hypothetical protein